jgi:hypothetical protein
VTGDVTACMVCGSIGYVGVNDVKNLYGFLESKGFSIVDQIVHTGMDYSHISDFISQTNRIYHVK